jgi:tripartite ATP-independent transporter DctP family solute receptor
MAGAALSVHGGARGVYAAPAPSTVLKLGFGNVRTTPIGSGAVAFARQVEQACAGRVRVELYPATEAGGEAEMAQDVRAGALDLCLTSGAGYGSVEPALGIFDIPFLFRDVAHARAVLDGPIGAAVRARLETHGVVGLAWGDNGLRHVTTASQPVRKPADLAGLKIRVLQSPVLLAGFKAFGADAAPLSLPELYGALASGAFQGQEAGIGTITGSNLDRVQKFLNLTAHAYSPALLMMSKPAFDRLAPEDRQAFAAAAALAADRSRQVGDQTETAGIETLRSRGMTIVGDVDRTAFAAALAPVQAEFDQRFGKDDIAAIRAFGK